MDRSRRTIRDSVGACALVGALALSLVACDWTAHWLAGNQRDIDESTRAIAAARDDAERARAYSTRGRAYSERARYSRTLQLIPPEEGERLFDLAIQDHGQAVTLAPGDAEVHLDRGLTLYSRAALGDAADPKIRAVFDAAVVDFTAALERDSRNEQAIDMRGLVHLSCGELDLAIDDFTQEMTISPRLGRMRLADAHCNRAGVHQKESRTELAISDYEKAIELGAPTDSCECQPHSPLASLYIESKQYDKAQEVVRRAQGAGGWIAPELVAALEKASGRPAR